MPKITLQKPTGQVSTPNGTKAPSILDRIRPVAEQASSTGIKLNVYGRGKTGKTRFACTFPKPLLLLGTEDGTKSVSTVEGVDFARVLSTDDMGIIIEELASSKQYGTVALDTAGGYQDIVLKEVLGLDEVPVSKYRQAGKGEAWGIADKGTWGTVGTRWKEVMAKFLDLADRHSINVVIIAHERAFGEESTSEVILPHIGAALTPSVAGWLNGACDYIVQTFVRQREKLEKVKQGSIETTIRKKLKGVDYCMRLGIDPIYMTGFRCPDGVVVPDIITDPHYDKIVKIISGEA